MNTALKKLLSVLLILSISMSSAVLAKPRQGRKAGIKKVNKKARKFRSVELFNGLNENINFRVDQNDLNIDLIKSNGKAKADFVLDASTIVKSFPASVKAEVYTYRNGEKKFISSNNVTVLNRKRVRAVPLTVDLGTFDDRSKEVFIDLFAPDGRHVNTYRSDFNVTGLEQINDLADLMEIDNADCPTNEFGKCQLDYILKHVEFAMAPSKQMETVTYKRDDGSYLVTLPALRKKKSSKKKKRGRRKSIAGEESTGREARVISSKLIKSSVIKSSVLKDVTLANTPKVSKKLDAGLVLVTKGDGTTEWQTMDGSSSVEISAIRGPRLHQVTGNGTTYTFEYNSGTVHTGTDSVTEFIFGSDRTYQHFNPIYNTRMFFDIAKASFRAGRAENSQWNNNNLGTYSAAFGFNTKAAGDYSFTAGYQNAANGHYSTALGGSNLAKESYSSAIGHLNEALSSNSVAIGSRNKTKGNSAYASGYQNFANGDYSTAIGYMNRTEGRESIAIGSYLVSNADYAITFGKGASAGNPYINNNANSFVVTFGQSTTTPTFYVGPPNPDFPNGIVQVSYITSNGGFAGNGGSLTNLDVNNVSAGILDPQYGGTGISNTSTLDLAGTDLTFAGGYAVILTSTAATNLTLPTTGTLATLSGVETFLNKTLAGVTINNGLTILDGNQANGYVLTSDGSGNATWRAPGSGSSPAGNNGSIQFRSGLNLAADATNFHWDDTNDRLGLGINSPAARFHLRSPANAASAGGLRIDDTLGSTALNLWIDNGNNNAVIGRGTNKYLNLTNSGNFGIGTTDPISKLHVVGALTVADGTQSNGYVLTADANGKASWQAAPTGASGVDGSVQFANGASLASDPANFFWDNANNRLGLGTNSPAAQLHMTNPTAGDTQVLLAPNGTANDSYIYGNSVAGASWIHLAGTTSTSYGGANSIGLYSSDTLWFRAGNSESMRINSNGNVGIATTSPGAKLHVNGSFMLTDGSQQNGYILSSDATGRATWTSVASLLSSGGNGNPAGLDGALQFRSGAGFAADTPNLFWDDTNNRLGLGTSSPVDFILDSNGSVGPHRNNSFNLGSATKKWANIFSTTGNIDTVNATTLNATTGYIATVNATNLYASVGYIATVNATTLTASSATINTVNSTTLNSTTVNASVLQTALTLGSVTFIGANGAIAEDNANFFWDDTNNRLGLGSAAPVDFILDANGSVGPHRDNIFNLGSATKRWASLFANAANFNTVNANTLNATILQTNLSAGSIIFIDANGQLVEDNSNLFWDDTNNRMGIGFTNPATSLAINGQVTIADGTQQNGFVLKSNANGQATWVNINTLVSSSPAHGLDGSVQFADNGALLSDNSNFFWDNTNKRFGLGTNTPAYDFELRKDQNAGTTLRATNNNNTGSAYAGVAVGSATDTLSMQYRPVANTANGGTYLDAGLIRTNASVDGGMHLISTSTSSTAYMSFSTADTERMAITKNGDVGISKQNPEARFHVVGTPVTAIIEGLGANDDQNVLELRHSRTGLTGGDTVAMDFNFAATSDTYARVAGIYSGSGSGGQGAIGLYTRFNGANSEKARLTNTGNFGIGFTVPISKLAVNGAVTIADGTQANGRILASDANGTAQWKDISALGITASASGVNGSIQFADSGVLASDPSNFFWDNSNNRLGIGTNAPSQSLHVNGIALANELRSSILRRADGTRTLIAADANDVYIGSDTTSATQYTDILLNSSGNTGIGILTPQAKLHVNGDFMLVDGNQQNGYVLVSDANGGASWADPAPMFSGQWTDTGTDLHPADASGAENVIIGGTSAATSDIILNADGSAIFNEQGAVADFRIEGDTEENLFFADASTNSVGIGTATPLGATYPGLEVGDVGLRGLLGVGTGQVGANKAKTVIQNLDPTYGTIGRLGWNMVTNTSGVTNKFASVGHSAWALTANVTNGSEYFRVQHMPLFSTTLSTFLAIDKDGNVGINTENPQAKLHVNGDVMISDGSQANGYVLASDPNGRATWTDITSLVPTASASGVNGSIQFSEFGLLASDPSNFFWDNSNNRLGIGTNTPAQALEVQGDALVDNIRLAGGVGQTKILRNTQTDQFVELDTAGNINIQGRNSVNLQSAVAGNEVVINENSLDTDFRVESDALSHAIFLNAANGNIGLAIAVPQARLHVNGSFMLVDGTEQAGYILSTDANGKTSWISSTTLPTSASGVNGSVQFAEGGNLASDPAQFFWDDTNNRLGLGTNTPNERLHVEGNIEIQDGGQIHAGNANTFIDIRDTTSVQPSMILQGHRQLLFQNYTATNANDGIYFDIGTNTGTTGNFFWQVNSTEFMRFTGAGNVGLGVTDPDSRMEVASALASSPALHIKSAAGQTADVFQITDPGDNGIAIFNNAGNLGLGFDTPAEKLAINGSLMMVDGTQQNGYVLTSDVNGKASWQNVDTLITSAPATGVDGSVQFANGGILASDATNFFWDNTNNRLGLGTNTPSATLEIGINGQIALPDGANTAPSMVFANDANTGIYRFGNDSLSVTTGGTDTLTVAANFVGVGTTAPQAGIDARVAGSNDNILRLEHDNATVNVPAFIINDTSSNSHITMGLTGTVFNEQSQSDQDFRIEGDNLQNLFFADVSADGVGINIAAPQANFHVNGSFMYTDGNQSNGYVLVSDANGGASWKSTSFMIAGASGANGSIQFADSGVLASDPSNFYWDDVNNRLGIGTNSPVTPLHISSGTGTSSGISFGDGDSRIYENIDDVFGFNLAGGQRWLMTTTSFQYVIGNTGPVLTSTSSPSSPAYQFTGDADTGMGNSQPNELWFTTAGSERLRIAADGNLGVGIAAPAEKLHVNGSLMMVDGTEANGYIMVSDANGKASWKSSSFITAGASGVNGSIQFAEGGILTSDASNFFWDNTNDRLGIGTNAPTADLHINHATNDTRMILDKGAASASIINNGDLNIDAPANTATQGSVNISAHNDSRLGTTHGSLALYASEGIANSYIGLETNSTDRLRIQNDGNVGINTTSPTARLHVNGDFRLVDGTQQNGYVLVSDTTGQASWQDASSLGIIASASGVNGSIQFATAGVLDSDPTNFFWDNANDRLGIGTNAPAAALDVQGGDVHSDGDILLTKGGGGSMGPGIFVEGTSSGAVDSEIAIYAAGKGSTSWLHGPNLRLFGNNFSRTANERGMINLTAGNVSAPVGDDGKLILASPSRSIDFRTTDNGSLGDTRMVIKNDGNIGINTYSPDSQLQVNGQIMIQDGTQADGRVLTSDANGKAAWETISQVITVYGGGVANPAGSTGAVQFNSGSGFGADTDQFYWNNGTKRFGVGTDNPLGKLHVNGGDMYHINPNTTTKHIIGEGTPVGEYGVMKWEATNDELRLGVSADEDIINIAETSRVGINTTAAPTSALEVEPVNAADTALHLQGFAAQSADIMRVTDVSNTDLFTINKDGHGQFTGSRELRFNDSSTRIYEGGGLNILTGLTSRPVKIGDTVERLRLTSTEIVSNEFSNDLDFRIEGDTDANLFVANAGTDNVGIGTANPNAKLHVIGDFILDDGSQLNGYVMMTDPNGRGSWKPIGSINAQASGPTGAVQFSNGGSLGSDPSEFFWDKTNDMLGIRTTSPLGALTIGNGQLVLPMGNVNKPSLAFNGSLALGMHADSITSMRFVLGDNTKYWTMGQQGFYSSDSSGAYIDRVKGLPTTLTEPTYASTGDQNSGMSFDGSDKIALVTGSSPRLTVTDNGRVGIATEFPGTKLAVNGNMMVTDNVGIGTSTPARKLHISDAMRIEPTAGPPLSPSVGDLYVDSTTNELCFYNGSGWVAISGGVPADCS